MRAELKEAEMNIYYTPEEATLLNHGKVTLNLIIEKSSAEKEKKLTIPYHRYWLCRAHGACPECGKQMDAIEDKCCYICRECHLASKWDTINIGAEK